MGVYLHTSPTGAFMSGAEHSESLRQTGLDGRSTPLIGAAMEPAHVPVADAVGSAAANRARSWRRSYRLGLMTADVAVIGLAVLLAQMGRFGLPLDVKSDWLLPAVSAVALIVVWLAALGIQQAWDVNIVGTGLEEYRRVVIATAWVCGAFASIALIFQLYPYIARGYVLIALSTGLVGLLLVRNIFRRRLGMKRLSDECSVRVLVLGRPSSVAMLASHFSRNKMSGYSIVGACIPGASDLTGGKINTASGIVPIMGDEESIRDALVSSGADALAITALDHIEHERMRMLTWELDSLGIDLIVVPGMTDVAGPRLKVRPVDNMPLFYITRPKHDRASRTQKRLIDLVCGSLGTIALLPLMILVAIAIKIDDGGPVFFRQVRVGFRGKPFKIFKFRTMLVGSDTVHDEEKAVQGQADVFCSKSADDRRITRVGQFLRRTSLDELPQLFNVIAGSMSLVGPRPLVPGEGASVEHFVERRSLIKPGMTGLWQVSGRSDVSPDERIRLDYSYVDNWSSVLDFVIMWRTVRAVLARDGAY